MLNCTTDERTREHPARSFCRIIAVLALLALVFRASARSEAQEPSGELQLAFVGDVMIGRWIGELTDKYGIGYPIRPVQSLLQEADIAFGNLESPLTTAPYLRKGYNLVADPAHIANITGAGFDIMGLANNHVTDHGPDGLAETIRTLDEAGIAHVGAGSTITEAHQIWIAEVGSIKVAYLACDSTWGSVPAVGNAAGSIHPDEQFMAGVTQARQDADVVVVSVHWGQEYKQLPNAQQKGFARALVRAGADIVVGHHPHVVQPLEWIPGPQGDRTALVAYSLGNFVFDQEFSEPTSESAILNCEVGRDGIHNARLIPLHIRRGQVNPVTTRQGEQVLSHLLPRQTRAAPYEVFSAKSLPVETNPELVEGLDFLVSWMVRPAFPDFSSTISEDVDGDGISETLSFASGRPCLSGSGGGVWCIPDQWQAWSGVLDDVDGDGLAEVIVLGQQNEETAPAAGSFVQIWELLDGEFRLGWRSLPGDYRGVWTVDMNGDGLQDLGVYKGG